MLPDNNFGGWEKLSRLLLSSGQCYDNRNIYVSKKAPKNLYKIYLIYPTVEKLCVDRTDNNNTTKGRYFSNALRIILRGGVGYGNESCYTCDLKRKGSKALLDKYIWMYMSPNPIKFLIFFWRFL